MLRVAPGFFGKVASHGDFVTNRFDRGLRQALDGWLQRSIDHSRRLLGAEWEPAFEAMPVWRFLLMPGVVGRDGFAGLMTPSTDRVGRHFPLLVATPLASPRSPELNDAAQAWFEAAEKLLLAARTDRFDLSGFDDALEALDPTPLSGKAEVRAQEGRSYWWTKAAGSRQRRFSAPGLPSPDSFARFLGGDAAPSNVVPLPLTAARPHAPALTLHAACASHPGTRLRIDATAMTSGARAELHAMAHGVGANLAAAKMADAVIERLSRMAQATALDDLVAYAKGALGSANTLLRRPDEQEPEPTSASIVALVAAEGRLAVLWAGDLRCYLLRDGLMRCLTRDHVEVGLRRRITRGVGTSAQFICDVVSDELCPGDRFLLIGADLVRLLGDRDTALRLAGARLADIPVAFVEDALIAGASCNIAVVAIEAASLRNGAAA